MKSNVRFVAIWAALVPVLTGAALLVSPLGIAHWSEVQTGLVVATVNACSALVLACVAYFWVHSVKEPAAVAGALTATVLSVVALGNVFAWWNLTDQTGQLIVSFAGSVFLLGLAIFVRQSVYAPETVEVEKAKAATPETAAR